MSEPFVVQNIFSLFVKKHVFIHFKVYICEEEVFITFAGPSSESRHMIGSVSSPLYGRQKSTNANGENVVFTNNYTHSIIRAWQSVLAGDIRFCCFHSTTHSHTCSPIWLYLNFNECSSPSSKGIFNKFSQHSCFLGGMGDISSALAGSIASRTSELPNIVFENKQLTDFSLFPHRPKTIVSLINNENLRWAGGSCSNSGLCYSC